MTYTDLSPIRHTSVTLRTSVRCALARGVQILQARQIRLSEQRLMRECLRVALKFWRGRGNMAGRNKKYNKRHGPYQIVPFYTTEALRSVAGARCHYAGISFSRLMDFAVANYLPRVLESWLRCNYRGRDREDVEHWRDKFARRRHPADFIIS